MKKCGKCETVKPFSDFKLWKPKGKPDKIRYQSYCRSCSSEYDKEYRAKNSDKIQAYREKHRDRQRSRDKARARPRTLAQYGLTVESFEERARAQDYRCLICGEIPTDTLVVDHCHTSDQVRGLLCRKHNAALGQFDDDPELLKKAVIYLESHL